MESARKNMHLTYKERCIIHEFLNYGRKVSEIARRIEKDRTTVAKEIKKHSYIQPYGKQTELDCNRLDKSPHVCNGCIDYGICKKPKRLYDGAAANTEYRRTISVTHSNFRKATPTQIHAINDVIAPLIVHKHQSVNHVYASHPETLPISKSTFYRWLDRGLLDIKNIDLSRKVRYKVKKEYNYGRDSIDSSIRLGRQYFNFQDYYEEHPQASIVEMDTVIGTKGGKGGKCFLTLLFRQFNFMLIYLMPYKKTQYVTDIFYNIKEVLGENEYKRLFEIILTDNGTEFSDPASIEVSFKTGERLNNVFYCDPNAAWQKGSLERNHQYIRYVLPKGSSFAGLNQKDCNKLASHINSVPRASLNNQSPYEAAKGFIGIDNIKKLGLYAVAYDDVNLTIRLLRK